MGSHFDDELTSPVEGAREAAAAEGPASPAVGRDEWVARHGERRVRRGGPLGTLEERLRRVPWWAWLTLFVVLFALLPVGVTDAYWRRVAFDTVLFMMLALGLNVVVGWEGCSTSATSCSTGSARSRTRTFGRISSTSICRHSS